MRQPYNGHAYPSLTKKVRLARIRLRSSNPRAVSEYPTKTTDGGGPSFWSADGHAIFYDGGDAIMRVELDFEPELRLGSPEAVVKRDEFVVIEAHPESGKLIAIREVEGSASTGDIHVILNWASALRPPG